MVSRQHTLRLHWQCWNRVTSGRGGTESFGVRCRTQRQSVSAVSRGRSCCLLVSAVKFNASLTPMELHFERYGQGHPLIILHGLFGSSENWRTLSKAFAQSFTVFALDQRNHGRSPHSEVFTYQAMTDDVREFMIQQGLTSAYVLGHSMGGKVAMQFALTYPDLIDKLIVVDI